MKEHVRELGTEQPFRTDIAYYEGRATGIATVDAVGVAEARLDLAQRHGFTSWALLSRHVAALRDGTEPPTPFMLAYRAVEDNDKDGLVDLLDGHPEDNPPSGWAEFGGHQELTDLLREASA